MEIYRFSSFFFIVQDLKIQNAEDWCAGNWHFAVVKGGLEWDDDKNVV